MSDSPYNSPEPSFVVAPDYREDNDILATRMTRLGASILDSVLLLAIILPIQFATGFMQRAMAQAVSPTEMIAMSFVGMIVFLAINGWSLSSRGQTVGKIAAGIQVVDFDTGNLLSLLRLYVFRYLWMLPFTIAVALVPGTADDMLVNVVALLNVLFIFGSTRRCAHDYIAGTKVVLYQPDRERLA